jgi:hypothetical protein
VGEKGGSILDTVLIKRGSVSGQQVLGGIDMVTGSPIERLLLRVN